MGAARRTSGQVTWQDPVTSRARQLPYGSQYASMAPLFEHYGVSLWMPEVGGRVDWHAEDHEDTMMALGLSSKREITRTRVRMRTAMAAQTLEQGRGRTSWNLIR